MKIDILTLFPEMFKGPFDESIIKRAREKELVKINVHNLRNWAKDKHKTVDDRPFGGGVGMVIRVDIVDNALNDLKSSPPDNIKRKIILLSAKGNKFNQQKALKLSEVDQIILIAGHYEGVDERVAEHLVDEEVSIGDFVLTGGELPAMLVTDAVVRLIPGVLEKPEATQYESFSPNTTRESSTLLEYPQYTRPAKYNNWKVPDVLLSGDHKKIEEWKRSISLETTKKKRPDLL